MVDTVKVLLNITMADMYETLLDIKLYLFIYLLFYVTFNSQDHIATGTLQVEETSAYCTVNHLASVSNYQFSNMKRPAQDSNRRPQRLEARPLTATPPSPLLDIRAVTGTKKRHRVLAL